MDTPNILICEDECLVAKDIEHSLKSSGYNVVGSVTRGEDAIQLAGKAKPDLVLMDIFLAGDLNGIETAMVLNKDYNIPVIYLTAFADESTLKRAKASCPLGYVVKPFEDSDLRSAIEVGLIRYHREQGLVQKLRDSHAQSKDSNVDITGKINSIARQSVSSERIDLSRHLIQKIVQRAKPDIKKLSEQLAAMKDQKISKEEFVKAMENSLRSCDQLESFLERLAQFSGWAKYDMKNLKINNVIREALLTADLTSRRDVSIHTHFAANDLLVSVDFEAVRKAFSYILTNAHQAMPFGGLITISTDTEFEEFPERHNPQAQLGWYVVTKISDGGIGMDSSIRERAFEPLVSDFKAGQHEGLGLSAVYGIMQSHGGWVKVESDSQSGTTISLYFPQVLPTKDIEDKESMSIAAERMPTVLIIDDEPALAELLQSFLADSGYRAYAFTKGSDALIWYQNHHQSVSMVFLDLRMPELDGAACFTKILELNPQQEIAIMSGYSDERTVRELLGKGALTFFEKPFDIRKLLSWLDQKTKKERGLEMHRRSH